MARVVFGVASFLPALAIAGALLLLFAPANWAAIRHFLDHNFIALWVLTAIGAADGWIIAFYFIHLVQRSDAAESQRLFWTRSLLQFFPIVAPIFWYRVIWKGMHLTEATRKA